MPILIKAQSADGDGHVYFYRPLELIGIYAEISVPDSPCSVPPGGKGPFQC